MPGDARSRREDSPVPLDPRLDALKLRQVEIVLCVAAGDSDRQIAEYLEVSVSTVRRGVRAAIAALGLSGRRALASAFSERRDPSDGSLGGRDG